MAPCLLLAGEMRLLACAVVAAVTLPGCYFGMRAGPSFQGVNGAALEGAGVEWDITAGIEVYTDDLAILNPLEGKNRIATGATATISTYEAPDAPVVAGAKARVPGNGPPVEAETVAGLWTVEVGRTIARNVMRGTEEDPRSGSLLRIATTFGAGEGSVRLTHADGSYRGGPAEVLSASGGIEGVLHWGGGSINGGGFVVGVGLKYSRFDAPDLVMESISPYVSLTIEGGVVLQALGHGLRGLTFVPRCR